METNQVTMDDPPDADMETQDAAFTIWTAPIKRRIIATSSAIYQLHRTPGGGKNHILIMTAETNGRWFMLPLMREYDMRHAAGAKKR